VAVDIFDYLPEREVDTLLEALPSLHAEELETLGDYEDETAGSIMSPEFVSLRLGATVADALTRLRRLALIGQNVTYVYVVEQEVLRGVLMMRDLVLNPPETPLADIMIKTWCASIRATISATSPTCSGSGSCWRCRSWTTANGCRAWCSRPSS
ncbi:MAG: CBS domain-containing protein, partial [Trueperaceae bacterium]|nr:CBS domain-containing protein [Trueperaceae bacterium]